MKYNTSALTSSGRHLFGFHATDFRNLSGFWGTKPHHYDKVANRGRDASKFQSFARVSMCVVVEMASSSNSRSTGSRSCCCS